MFIPEEAMGFTVTAENPVEVWPGDPRVKTLQSGLDTPEALQAKESAWTSIYTEHGNRLISYARVILGSSQEVEDVVQQSFLKAYTHIDRFEDTIPNALTYWLRSITRNTAIDFLRRSSRSTLMDTETIDDYGADPYMITANRADPHNQLIFKETLGELQDNITPSQFKPMILSAAGFSYDEISAQIGASEDKVRGFIARGRRSARKILSRELSQEEEQEGKEGAIEA